MVFLFSCSFFFFFLSHFITSLLSHLPFLSYLFSCSLYYSLHIIWYMICVPDKYFKFQIDLNTTFTLSDLPLYHGESWELMQRRWAKLEKDFRTKNRNFDISKIPDIYDCIKYDLQHNHHTLQFEYAEELYKCAKYLADVVIPQVGLCQMPRENCLSPFFFFICLIIACDIKTQVEFDITHVTPYHMFPFPLICTFISLIKFSR